MLGNKVCVYAGEIGTRQFALLEEYAASGYDIALMDRDKQMGQSVKKELERMHHISVFFFHGDIKSEEDQDLFWGVIQDQYKGEEVIICSDMCQEENK